MYSYSSLTVGLPVAVVNWDILRHSTNKKLIELATITRSGWLGVGLYGKSRQGMGLVWACRIFLPKWGNRSGQENATKITKSMPTGLMSLRTLLHGVSGLFAGSFLLLCSILAALLQPVRHLWIGCLFALPWVERSVWTTGMHFMVFHGISMFAKPFWSLNISDTVLSKLSGSQVDQRMFFEAAMRHLGSWIYYIRKVLKWNWWDVVG